MKFLQFYKNGEAALGLVTEGGIVDVGANEGCPKTMLELCRSGDVAVVTGVAAVPGEWIGRGA